MLAHLYKVNGELIEKSETAIAAAKAWLGPTGWRQFKASDKLSANLRVVVEQVMACFKDFPSTVTNTEIGVQRAPILPGPGATRSVNPKQMGDLSKCPPYNTQAYIDDVAKMKTNFEREVSAALPGWMVLWGHQAKHTHTHTHTHTHSGHTHTWHTHTHTWNKTHTQ